MELPTDIKLNAEPMQPHQEWQHVTLRVLPRVERKANTICL